MPRRKQIALIAHDNCKAGLLDWARFNRETLAGHELYATGTTGALLADELDLPVNRFLSGPLGGDQQSALRSPRVGATSSSSSGTHSSHTRTTWT